MSIVKRVRALERGRLLKDKLYVQSVIFNEGMMDDSQPFCEFRDLFLDDGGKGTYVKRLEPGELLSGAAGGMEPWIPNPGYDPSPEHRKQVMEAAKRRSA